MVDRAGRGWGGDGGLLITNLWEKLLSIILLLLESKWVQWDEDDDGLTSTTCQWVLLWECNEDMQISHSLYSVRYGKYASVVRCKCKCLIFELESKFGGRRMSSKWIIVMEWVTSTSTRRRRRKAAQDGWNKYILGAFEREGISKFAFIVMLIVHTTTAV